MKRNYVTPMIAVEYYNLTQSIAACDKKIGFWDRECVLNDADATPQMKAMADAFYFMAEGNCIFQMQTGDDPFTGICYHTNANAAFNS